MLPLEPVFTFAPKLHQDLDLNGSETHQGLLVLWEKLGGGEIWEGEGVPQVASSRGLFKVELKEAETLDPRER